MQCSLKIKFRISSLSSSEFSALNAILHPLTSNLVNLQLEVGFQLKWHFSIWHRLATIISFAQ